METQKTVNSLDEQETILIKFKNPKRSSDVVEKETKDLVSPLLVDQQLEVESIKSTDPRTVMIKTNPVPVTCIKSIVDGLICLESATTAII